MRSPPGQEEERCVAPGQEEKDTAVCALRRTPRLPVGWAHISSRPPPPPPLPLPFVRVAPPQLSAFPRYSRRPFSFRAGT